MLEYHSAPCIGFFYPRARVYLAGIIKHCGTRGPWGPLRFKKTQELKLHLRRGDPQDQSRLRMKSTSGRRT